MNVESLTASLHSGLIQRARPAKVVPLGKEAGAGWAAVLPLRAGDLARGRPAPASPVDTGRPAIARVLTRTIAPVEAVGASAAGSVPARRFGLTVRVGAELRERLGAVRERTGRTTQSILHDALAGYLAALERKTDGER